MKITPLYIMDKWISEAKNKDMEYKFSQILKNLKDNGIMIYLMEMESKLIKMVICIMEILWIIIPMAKVICFYKMEDFMKAIGKME